MNNIYTDDDAGVPSTTGWIILPGRYRLSALQFPCTIFKTKKSMDDYHASDMRCGDLSEAELKRDYHLVDVSTRVDPYTLRKITPFTQPHARFYGSRNQGEKVTRAECARILFDELRDLSRTFSLYGPYQHVIKAMFTHMQYGDGRPFSSLYLDTALREHLLRDKSKNSTLLLLDKAFLKNIDWGKGYYPVTRLKELSGAVADGRLPKFNRYQDCFNGLGITVHDTWATHIAIKSFQVKNDRYRVILQYKVQDHFGLDSVDISSPLFSKFRFFRIWYVLQRFNQFSFKPFMTNIEATIEINRGRYDS